MPVACKHLSRWPWIPFLGLVLLSLLLPGAATASAEGDSTSAQTAKAKPASTATPTPLEQVTPPRVIRLPDIDAIFEAALDGRLAEAVELPELPQLTGGEEAAAEGEPPVPEEVPVGDSASMPGVSVGDVVVEEAKPTPPPPNPWSGRVELGFNGAEGNSQLASTRVGLRAIRKTEATEFTAKLTYNITNSMGERTENQLIGESRFEHFHFKPFSYYVHGTYEFDQFTAFDYRLTADAGLAWNIIHDGNFDFYLINESTNLKLRGGAGTSREFGIPDAEYIPEASFGFSFSHQLTKRQRLSADSDYFPDVRDWNDYRIRSNATWEIKVDPEGNMSIKFSLIDRYDSTPHGKKHNDLTYAAQLVWDF